MKKVAAAIIKAVVARCPWGVCQAMLDGCFVRLGYGGVSERLLPKMGISEVGIQGALGLIRSSWNDREVLATYARTGAMEPGIVELINAFYGNEPGTYIDVGANIGLTTIPIARNDNIRCIAIEPEPGNFRFLKLNVENNVQDSVVEFHQSAVVDRPGVVSMAIADGNLGDHRVTVSGIPGRRTIEVEAIALDGLLDRVTGKLAVKIDTQGAEPAVIAGGREVLARAGLISIEFCPYLMRQMGGDPDVVIQLISGFDEVAVSESGSDAQAVFGSAAAAVDMLRSKAANARDSDGDFLNVLARRNRNI